MERIHGSGFICGKLERQKEGEGCPYYGIHFCRRNGWFSYIGSFVVFIEVLQWESHGGMPFL